MFLFPHVKGTLTSYVLSDAVVGVDIVTTDNAFGHCGPVTVSFIHFWYQSQADNVKSDDDMDESLDDRPGMPIGRPEPTTTQPPTSNSDLHTVVPMPIDIHADKTQVPATTGVREEGVLAPAMVEKSPMSTSAPPTDVSLVEDLPQPANGPAPKKWKVAARVIVSDSISDK